MSWTPKVSAAFSFSRSEKNPRPVREPLKLWATQTQRRNEARAKKNIGLFEVDDRSSHP